MTSGDFATARTLSGGRDGTTRDTRGGESVGGGGLWSGNTSDGLGDSQISLKIHLFRYMNHFCPTSNNETVAGLNLKWLNVLVA